MGLLHYCLKKKNKKMTLNSHIEVQESEKETEKNIPFETNNVIELTNPSSKKRKKTISEEI